MFSIYYVEIWIFLIEDFETFFISSCWTDGRILNNTFQHTDIFPGFCCLTVLKYLKDFYTDFQSDNFPHAGGV